MDTLSLRARVVGVGRMANAPPQKARTYSTTPADLNGSIFKTLVSCDMRDPGFTGIHTGIAIAT